jgi:hypothetical protein
VKKADSGGFWHHHLGKAWCHGGAEFNTMECGALTVINTNQPSICMRKLNPLATVGAPISLMLNVVCPKSPSWWHRNVVFIFYIQCYTEMPHF